MGSIAAIEQRVPTPASIRTCAVIPAFDAADTVADMVRAAARHVDVVIVVNDGSRDRTGVAMLVAAAVVAHSGARVDVVMLPTNRGKGAALVAGFRRARGLGCTHAVTIDADGRHDAADIPALLAASAAHPRAIVVGARTPTADRDDVAARVGRVASKLWTRAITGFDLSDAKCGFRVYPVREVLELPVRARRFDYEGEVLVRGAWAGLELVGVPIDERRPGDAVARAPRDRSWADGARTAAMHVRLGLLGFCTWGAPPAR